MTDHTPMSKLSRLEVIQTGARRRWTAEEKQRIVAESETGPRQVSATARRYGLSPAQLFNWRRSARAGGLGGSEDGVTFAKVVACSRAADSQPRATAIARSRFEIVLADGIRIIADEAVDAGALARVICAIERR